jgi:hypothetical protein
MRMWPNVNALSGQQLGRPGLVKEDERPDHLSLWRGQGAPHLEAAKVPSPRDDERFYRVDAHLIGAPRFKCWIPTHPRHPHLVFQTAPPLLMRLPDVGQSGSCERVSAFGRTKMKSGEGPSSPLALQCTTLCRSKWNALAMSSRSAAG